MIRHIVLVRFPADIAAGDIDGIFQQLSGLTTTLPGMIDFHAGTNVNTLPHVDQGFTHAFTIDFADAAARDAYFDSAEHVAVLERAVPLLTKGVDDIAMFQIELQLA